LVSDLGPEVQRFPPRYRLNHGAAEDFEQLSDQLPNCVFVFDEQDRQPADTRLEQTRGGTLAGWLGYLCIGLGLVCRKEQAEPIGFRWIAARFNEASVFGDE